MNKNQLIPISIIVAAVAISGFFLVQPGGQTTTQGAVALAQIIDGKQVLPMKVSAVSYEPNRFKVKAGIPVRWEMTLSGSRGCASGAVFAKGLLEKPVYINPDPGQVTVAEFTPQTPGTYKFNCSMNMARGAIEVVQ